MLGEIGLVFCVLFYGLNGLRIAYYDLFTTAGGEIKRVRFAHSMNGLRQIMVDHIQSRRARMMFGWLIFLAWVVITFIGGFAIVGAAHKHLATLN